MDLEHYFSADPASAAERRPLMVTLAGHDLELETAGGIFSPDRVDLGTSVLLRSVPPPPVGDLLDLGCGWGPIALTLGLLAPEARVWAVDVNARARALLSSNARAVGARLPLASITAAAPDEVPPGIEFAAMWSNPPIRIGKEALHALLTRWLPRLASGGSAYLVVQRHLGADSLAAWLAVQTDDSGAPWGRVERLASAKGFRVLRLMRT